MPFIYILIYLGLDVMVCMFDANCNVSLFSFFYSFEEYKSALTGMQIEAFSILFNSFGSLANPYLFIDDIFQVSLIFLLGALIFKTSKTGKTLGSIILINMVFKLAIAPLAVYFSHMENMFQMGNAGYLDYSPESFSNAYPLYAWVWSHLSLIDTVKDTILNCFLLFFVWLRLKRMKL